MATSILPKRMPHSEPVRVGNLSFSAADVIEILGPFLSEPRKQKIAETVTGRTYTITPVLDQISDGGNFHAVLRSAESLGFQSVHVIERKEQLKRANRVSLGSEKWLDIQRWKSPSECIQSLKNQGYRIVTMTPFAQKSIAEIDFTLPTALIFGNEKTGISEEVNSLANDECRIPMTGFTESFNISVAAALSLYHVYRDRILLQGHHGDLTQNEALLLQATYYRRSVSHSDELLLRLAKDRGIVPQLGTRSIEVV